MSENRVEAIQKTPRRLEVPDEKKHDEYGRVPAYLAKRKDEVVLSASLAKCVFFFTFVLAVLFKWAVEEENRRAAQPDPSCPPGMVLMAEEERVQVGELLLLSLLFRIVYISIIGVCRLLMFSEKATRRQIDSFRRCR